MKHFLLQVICSLSIMTAYSQSQIKITVLDSVSKVPLPFANIYLKETGIGTTTNLKGIAHLQVKKQNEQDTLICRYVGYDIAKVPVELNQNTALHIELVPVSKELEKVAIVYKKPLSAHKILKNVLKSTRRNYVNAPVNLQGLYRETIQESGVYTILNEAIVDIHYTAYPQKNIDIKTYKKWQYDDTYAFEYKSTWFDGFPVQFNTREDKVRLIAARTSETASPGNMDIPINGGPLSLTAKDYVKYRYDFLNPKTFNNYNYRKAENETLNGRICYVIDFFPKASDKRVVFNHIRKNQNSIYVGKMYIDKKSFAVVKIEYQLIQNFDYGFYQDRIPLEYTVTVDYAPDQSEKWFLNKVELEQVRKVYNPELKKAFLVNATQELFITTIDSIAIHEISPENEWKHTRITQLRTYELPYDSSLWGKYESSTGYPELPLEVTADLEKNRPLDIQFKSRFKQKENLPAPLAQKKPFTFNYPTESMNDDYQWFAKEEHSTAFYAYISAENEYAANYILPYRTYQRSFFNAINNFYLEDTIQPVRHYKKGDFSWAEDSLENLVLWEYQDTLHKTAVFNFSQFISSRKRAYVSSAPKMTDDHFGLIYTVDGGLHNQLVLFEKGNPVPIDSISGVYSFEWFNDSLLLYTKENAVKRSDKLFCRDLKNHSDSLLYFEPDLTFDIDLMKTKSYLAYTLQSKDENEIYLVSKNKSYPNFELFLKKEKNVYSTLKEFNGSLYLLTNKGAPNNKVLRANNGSLTELVPHDPKTYILDFTLTENYIALNALTRSLPVLKFKMLTAKKWTDIDLGKTIFEADFGPLENDKLSLLISTPRDPQSQYIFDLNKEQLTRIKNQKIKYLYEAHRRFIGIERCWAKTEDGTKVPMTIIKSNYPKRKHKGLILKAYGSYGTVYGGYGFDSEDFILLREGYTIAYAHVRGGGEMGYEWYTDGRLLDKENTFNDYIACAEFLIRKKYTDADHLIGYGNSAGGLLMGVVINRRPELFNTVILDHPYLDALTTMMMDTLPLTTDHYKEVGNPNDPEVYDYMKGYAPYHNIKKQAYPNLLFLASSNDYQTPTWQVAKYVAKLRAHNTGSGEILFKTDIGSGHIGSTNGKQWMKDLAYKNAFIYSNLFKE